jgi:hypothetical protein
MPKIMPVRPSGFRSALVRFRMGSRDCGGPVALVLTITTGQIERERVEAFQVTFRTLLSRRFDEAPFLRQAMLVHLGDSVWQMLTLWDSGLAQTHAVDNDVPLTVRIFRDFGTDPEIRLADVSSFLQPRSQRLPRSDETAPYQPETPTELREPPPPPGTAQS